MLVCVQHLATHAVAGSAAVVAAEAAEQEIVRLRREVADLQSGRQSLEREREELRKVAEGEFFP